MFIHLGEDKMIRTKEVIAIFDYGLFAEGGRNHPFLSNANSGEQAKSVDTQAIKSVVVTEDNLYLSPFSPATLKRRSEQSSINDR